MYRKVFSMLIIVCVFFMGCGVLKHGYSYERISKKLLELSTYSCDVTLKVTNNRSTMEYKVRHYYKRPDKYRIEVLAPKELEGQVTVYNGSSSYIYHPGINQYLVTENFTDSIDCNAFIGSFMNHVRQSDDIKISNEKNGEKEFIIVEFEIPEPNSYMKLERLWIDPETAFPVKAEIYGNDDKANVKVYYDNFVCNPDLKDGDFEIIQKN